MDIHKSTLRNSSTENRKKKQKTVAFQWTDLILISFKVLNKSDKVLNVNRSIGWKYMRSYTKFSHKCKYNACEHLSDFHLILQKPLTNEPVNFYQNFYYFAFTKNLHAPLVYKDQSKWQTFIYNIFRAPDKPYIWGLKLFIKGISSRKHAILTLLHS